MSCNHEWSKECYDVVPSQVCVRCNAFQVEEEHAELVRDAFRRGAEAMREACIGTACAQDLDLDAQDRMEEQLRALPIPEEP